ncbi:hypothetical protein SDC9_48401 [bioreactor metagenome]|uniref:Proline dehydrogenase domain-containing protein n=1 Tax=bioreactor metagenome TaxID=1076179 RepID=A0A644WE78_9ZZZZ
MKTIGPSVVVNLTKKQMPDFYNTEIAFRQMDDQELKRNLRIFGLMRFPLLIIAGKPLIRIANVLHFPLKPFLGNIYRIFTAGRTLEEAVPVMEKLKAAGIMSVPDYSAESGGGDAARDAVAEEIKRTIILASQKREMIPFAVFKPSGISNPELLSKKSAGKTLNDEENMEWKALYARWENIFSLAADKKVSVMVDSEESWTQQAVDDLIFEFMLRFNKDMPVVINTLQMYRHDRLEFLDKTIAFARDNNLFAGIKFVRGAYHEKENRYANARKIIPAVYQSKTKTDAAYNQALSIALKNIDLLTIVCATHNEESVRVLTREMKSANIAVNDRRIWFSQLHGMSNHISFALAAGNYNVAKYLPYAPIRVIMPYLIRRAEENTAVMGQTLREFELLKKESERRKSLKI